jgi:CO/xanthine dehydrogenase Mo-binding subunit
VNPRIVDTQISGATIMQFGFTMLEAMEFTDGQLRNPSLADYKIPGIRDLPIRFEAVKLAARKRSWGGYVSATTHSATTHSVAPFRRR